MAFLPIQGVKSIANNVYVEFWSDLLLALLLCRYSILYWAQLFIVGSAWTAIASRPVTIMSGFSWFRARNLLVSCTCCNVNNSLACLNVPFRLQKYLTAASTTILAVVQLASP